jgi:hypothetical protein
MSEVHSGNFASGQTDRVIEDTRIAAIPRALFTGLGGPNPYKTVKANQCPGPFISPFKGGSKSSILLQNQMTAAAICNAANDLAAAKLRQIPGCPVNAQTRFAHYQSYQPPAPCPVSTINPAIPKALNGPCTNVIGIVQTWPPH